MADLYDDPTIQEIRGKLDNHAAEIVVLKGAVAALLHLSNIRVADLGACISTAAKRPAGQGDPKSAADTTEFFNNILQHRPGCWTRISRARASSMP